MSRPRTWLVGGLLAGGAAWAVWHGASNPPGTPAPSERVRTTSPSPAMPPTSANSSGAQAAPPASPLPASDDSDDLNDAPSPESPDTPQERVVNELAAEAANLALERLGDRYIDYLVDNGLSRPDAEDIVTTGFHAAGRCSLEAMREQAQVESVPLDTVLRALHAELYDTDGPILMRTIDLQAVAAREAPCALNALQEAGIPPSVAAEIQRAALSE